MHRCFLLSFLKFDALGVVVCERIFRAEYDDDWPAILDAVAAQAGLVHARVGYREGPQVGLRGEERRPARGYPG